MNIVVTGATSFIGSSVTERLLREGHRVYAVVRPGSRNLSRLNTDVPGLTVISEKLENLDQIAAQIPEICEGFLHFGWDGAGSRNRTDRVVQQKNVQDSLKALEGARTLGVKRFLFSGSQAEYGPCHAAMTEDTPLHPVSEYGKAKVDFYHQASGLVRQWRKEGSCEMEYIHTRLFSIYGPGDHPWSLVESCLRTFQENGSISLGECTQKWNFLYIDDLTRALVRLITFPGPIREDERVFNLAGDESATRPLREYVEEMYRLCGSRGSFSYGDREPNAEGPVDLIPDIGRITRVTGWKPKITFEEGILKMIDSRTCLLCGHKLPPKPLMKLEDMPSSAQDIPDAVQVKSDCGISLNLCQCGHCGLVQFDCEPVPYYRDVIRSGGFSTTMVELRRRQYRHLIETYHLEGKNFIEVGCGQGEFLSVLNQFPVNAYGIEHKVDLVKAACAQGLSVYQGFAESGKKPLIEGQGPFDVFLSFNFLEHQPEPEKMLRCIYDNLAEDGMGLITVPSLEYILHYDGYYELIRDHLAYYTFDSLRYLLEQNGFQVLEEEMVNRDTLSVIVKKVSGQEYQELRSKPACVREVDVSGLIKTRQSILQEVDDLIRQLEEQNKKLAVWGASHQGFTLAATAKLGDKARYMIDSAPFKQGRFAPVSHIPIVAPQHFMEETVDTILIVAPGYTEEIAGAIRKMYGTEVQVLTLRSSHIEEI